jgi:long-chain acyl-CoA synthetase
LLPKLSFLQKGEYISPEKVESAYARSQFVAQIMIEGNSLKDYIIAIVVPDQVYLMDYCQKANIGGDFKTLCESKYVKRVILEDLIKYGKLGGLMSYEQVCCNNFTTNRICF